MPSARKRKRAYIATLDKFMGPMVSSGSGPDIELRLPGRRRVMRLKRSELPAIRALLALLDRPSTPELGPPPPINPAPLPVIDAAALKTGASAHECWCMGGGL